MGIWSRVKGLWGSQRTEPRPEAGDARGLEVLEQRILLSADQPLSELYTPLDPDLEPAGIHVNLDGTILVTTDNLKQTASRGASASQASQSESDFSSPGSDQALTVQGESDVDGTSLTIASISQVPGAAAAAVDETYSSAAGQVESRAGTPAVGDAEFVVTQRLGEVSPRGPPAVTQAAINQVIFVEAAVNLDSQLKNADLSGVAVVVLDANRDGVQQITDVLSSYQNLSAIHIISHGAPGEVTLGTVVLSSSSLESYASDLAAWGRSLTQDADILLYGCSAGLGSEGETFVRAVAGLTGGDVAASDDATGSASLGGNWLLEEATGPIEARVLVARFDGLLASGGRDPGFGIPGVVVTKLTLGGYDESATGVVIQPDGKMVVAGYCEDGSGYFDFAVVRYNVDGTLDTTFSGDGKVTTSFSTWDDGASCVAIQADGKIVAAGYADTAGGYWDIALVRYNSNGSLDTTLDTDGKVTTDVQGRDDEAYGIVIQSDGKIVVAGYTCDGSSDDFALVRYNSDGSLDTTFDSDGKVSTDFSSPDDQAYAVALQPDGRIVAAGKTFGGSDDDIALAMYNSDGSLDTSFDGDGKLTTDFGLAEDVAEAVAVQPDGKIVVAGESTGSSGVVIAVVRYNVDGTLDTTFSGDGMLTTPVGTDVSVASGIAIQPDGKIIAAGFAHNGNDFDFALVRYNADGSIDPTFSGDGIVTVAIGSDDDECYAMALQPDGKIVAAGCTFDLSTYEYSLSLARFNADGSLDATIPGRGFVVTPVGYSDGMGLAVALQSDGKIVVAGYSDTGGDMDFSVVRYNSDGTLDTSFGWGGVVIEDIGGYDDYVYDVAIQSDGKIVVAGWSYSSTDCDFAVVRYNVDGSLDTTFSGDGMVTTAIGSGDDRATGVAIQSDGKIVVAGQYWYAAGLGGACVVRYNVDGTLDTSFGTGGIVTTVVGLSCGIDGLAVQNDGKIAIEGMTSPGWGENTDILVIRYDSVGMLDTSFSGDGIVTTRFASAGGVGQGIGIQADGKIVVAGYKNPRPYQEPDIAVVRYNTDGTLDTTFSDDGDGIVTTSIVPGSDTAEDLVIQADGKIVVTGESYNGSNYDVAVVRYNGDGTLDTSFAAGGKLTTALGTGDDDGFSVAIQPDGMIVVAGYSDDGMVQSFAVVRYLSTGNAVPTLALANVRTAPIQENTDLISRLKVADIVVADDGVGTTVLSLSGDDAALFEIDGSVLYFRAGTPLDYETNPQLDVTVVVDDSTVGATPDATASLSIAVGDVYSTWTIGPSVWGPAGLTLIRSGNVLHVYTTGTTNDVLPPQDIADVSNLVFTGRATSNDTLTVDFSGGNPIPGGGVSYDGGVGGNDTLALAGGSFTTITFGFTGVGSGTIGLDGSTITYSGLEPIVSTAVAASVVLNYSSAGETITVASAGSGRTTVSSTAAETVTFNNPTGSLTINSGGGGDLAVIQGLGSGFDADLTVRSDDVKITGTVDVGSGVAAFVPFAGGSPVTLGSPDVSFASAWGLAGSGSNIGKPDSVIRDTAGNVITAGYFDGTVDFDPGPGVTALTSNGGDDAFICALDSSGNLAWARSIGGPLNDLEYGTVRGGSGNLYMIGRFGGTVDFDPGLGVVSLTSAGGEDVFVLALDCNGNFLWARSMGGASWYDYGMGIVVDESENVYATGMFEGTVDFDPGPGVANLTSHGRQDIFVLSLDANGDYRWAKDIGGSLDEGGERITANSEGNICVTGEFEGLVDFDPGSGTMSLASSGGDDVFLLSLDSSGSFLWARALGGAGDDVSAGIATDRQGNTYTSGYFPGTVDFDPGPGTTNLTSKGGYDVFLLKLDGSGDFLWAESLGGVSDDQGFDVAMDSLDNVYVTGRFQATVDFDPGPGVANLSSSGADDLFVLALDRCGDFLWAKAMGGPGIDTGIAITVDSSDNVYVAGNFQDTVDFDPGGGAANLTARGLRDVFLARFTPVGGRFTLTDGEVDLVTTTGKIVVGDGGTGDVTFTSAISPAHAARLDVVSGGAIGDLHTADHDYEGTQLVLNGNVHPGTSAGIGVLGVAGDIRLADSSTLSVQIAGTTPGAADRGYDQLDVAGTVSIGNNVGLSVSSWKGYVPSQGASFTLISNDSSGATLTELQALPSGLTRYDMEAFMMDGQYYLAVANARSATSYSVPSVIYRWDGSPFVGLQSMYGYLTEDWEYFTIGSDHFLFQANAGEPLGSDSRIYKWNGTQFELFQTVTTKNINGADSFVIDGETYLACARVNYFGFNVDSVVYKWNGSSFIEYQDIPTTGAYDFEHFSIAGDDYLLVLQVFDGSTGAIDSKIYKWDGSLFQEYQRIATGGAHGADVMTMQGQTYLAIADSLTSVTGVASKLYKWDGAQFEEYQTLTIRNTYDFESFSVGGHAYLAEGTCQADDAPSVIYEWNGTSFEEFMVVPTGSAVDWESMTIDGRLFLAYARANWAEPSQILEWAWTPEAVQGTFNGLPEGGSFTVGGQFFRITYKGGDGNDVVITANSAPTDITLSNTSVPENEPVGTPVGTFTTTDPGPSDTHTYSLAAGDGDGDNASFSIDGDRLKTAQGFDYEAKSSYSIRVRSTDQGGLWTEEQFTVTVGDVNESPTDIALSSISVAENEPAGTVVGVVSGTDPDAGQSAPLVFRLVSGFGDNSLFTIDPATNQLKTAATFDYEARNSYQIKIQATDCGSPALSYDKEFTISVTDVNEAPSVALANVVTSLPENSNTSVRIRVADIVVTDDGIGTNVLSLSGPDASKFVIDGSSLYLKAGLALNHATKSHFDVTVAVDDASVGVTPDSTASLTVLVTASDGPVFFADANLKAAVEAQLGVKDPTATDMLRLTGLDVVWVPVTSLIGLQFAANLEWFDLQYTLASGVSDLTPLADLTNLACVDLGHNAISDISCLADSKIKFWLKLDDNPLDEAAYTTYLNQIAANNQGIELKYDNNPRPPASVSASDGTYADKVRVTWELVANGPRSITDPHYYVVYRSDSATGPKTCISNWQSGMSFDDTTARPGVHYWYWVVATCNWQFGLPDEGYAPALSANPVAPVAFADANLKAAVEAALDTKDPTPTDMLRLTGLDVVGVAITSLAGLEYATNLGWFDLQYSGISDLTPLSGLANLSCVDLRHNAISDISALGSTRIAYSLKLNDNPLDGAAYSVYLSEISLNDPGIALGYNDNPRPVTGVAASDGVYSDKVHVAWDALANGPRSTSDPHSYLVYRSDLATGAKSCISGWLTGTSFDDTSAQTGMHYWYWVTTNLNWQFSMEDEGSVA